jgi:fused signal recognition particle receptor
VARSWTQLLGDAEGPYESEVERAGFFGRLRDSLSRSRKALAGELAAAAFDPADEESWERLEEALLRADVGVRATAEIVRRLEARPDLADLGTALVEELTEMFGEAPRLDVAQHPAVILVVGVNGTGKTTTIGKLSQKLREHGRTVTLGAGGDVIVIDTAGRLHTQSNLMDELAKVRRVIAGRIEGAPHETLLVIDATTGQNGLQQARLFAEAVGVTGVVLT